jgi:hypothetical protein
MESTDVRMNDGMFELATGDGYRFQTAMAEDVLLYSTHPECSMFLGVVPTQTFLRISPDRMQCFIKNHEVWATSPYGIRVHGDMRVESLNINGEDVDALFHRHASRIEMNWSHRMESMQTEIMRSREYTAMEMSHAERAINEYRDGIEERFSKTERTLQAHHTREMSNLRTWMQAEMGELKAGILKQHDALRKELYETIREDLKAVLHKDLYDKLMPLLEARVRAYVKTNHDRVQTELCKVFDDGKEQLTQQLKEGLNDELHRNVRPQLEQELKQSAETSLQEQICDVKDDVAMRISKVFKDVEAKFEDHGETMHGIAGNLNAQVEECRDNTWQHISDAISKSESTMLENLEAAKAPMQETIHEAVVESLAGLVASKMQDGMLDAVMTNERLNQWIKEVVADVVQDLKIVEEASPQGRELHASVDDLERKHVGISGNVQSLANDTQHMINVTTWCSNAYAELLNDNSAGAVHNASERALAIAEWCSNAVMVASRAPHPVQDNAVTSPTFDIGQSGASNMFVKYKNSEKTVVLGLRDELYYPPFAIVPPLLESQSKHGLGFWAATKKGKMTFYTGEDRVGLPIERMVVTNDGIVVHGVGNMTSIKENGVELSEKYASKHALRAVVEKLCQMLLDRGAITSRLSISTLFNEQNTTRR